MIVEGKGVHGGRHARVRLHRDDGPVRFLRGGTEIAARLESVVATERCTTLGAGAARVAVVEHLLGAMHAAGWWTGVVVETDADELPILDGSAMAWRDALRDLGDPPAAPAPLHVREGMRLAWGPTEAAVAPGDTQLCVEIRFAHPAIGRQRWCGGPARYHELVDARTFGLLSEAHRLRREGLAIGAGLENVIVFGDEGPLRPLRTPDEPVRHKALDALGDLFLLERPLHAEVTIVRGSHRTHVELAHALLRAAVPDAEAPA